MKTLVEFLMNEIGDDSYHELRDVSGLANTANGEFDEFLNDRTKEPERLIMDDLLAYKYVDEKEKKIHYGFTSLNGEVISCITFEDITEEELKIIVDYGNGVVFSKEYTVKRDGKEETRNRVLAYVHRTKYGHRLLNLTDTKIRKRWVKSILLLDHEDYNKYIVSCYIEGGYTYQYYSVYVENNTIQVIEDVNNMIYTSTPYKEGMIWDLFPITYDLFKFKSKHILTGEELVFVYSKYYNKILNQFPTSMDVVRVFPGLNPTQYIEEGILVLYAGIKDDKGLDKGGDILIAPLNPIEEGEKGKAFILNPEFTQYFQPLYGSNMFYSVVLSDDPDKPHKFFFFKPENGELRITDLEATSVPTQIYVDKTNFTVTLVYDVQGYYQVVTFFENGLELMKYSYIEVKPIDGVDIDVQLSKFKGHIESLNIHQNQADDEMYNLHYFNDFQKGLGRNNFPVLISSQYCNITNNLINTDVKRIYMPLNGKIQLQKGLDNTVKEYVLTRNGDIEKRLEAIEELNRDTSEFIDRVNSKIK